MPYCMSTPFHAVVIIGATLLHIGAALIVVFAVEPAADAPAREGLLYEDWALFIALLGVYAGSVFAVLRLIIVSGVSDRYSIFSELATCFLAWLGLAGLHFGYVILVVNSPTARDFQANVLPSHLLLLVMFLTTFHASVGKPVFFGKRGMRGTISRAVCWPFRYWAGEGGSESDSPSLKDAAARDFSSMAKEAQLKGEETGAAGEAAAQAGLMRLLGFARQTGSSEHGSSSRRHGSSDSDSDRLSSSGSSSNNEDEAAASAAVRRGGAASKPLAASGALDLRGAGSSESGVSRAGSRRMHKAHSSVRSNASTSSRGRAVGSMPYLRSVATMAANMWLSDGSGRGSRRAKGPVAAGGSSTGGHSRTEVVGVEGDLAGETAALWATVLGTATATPAQLAVVDAVTAKSLRLVWTLPALLSTPPATVLVRRFAQQLLCPEVIDFYVAAVEYRAMVAECQKRSSASELRLMRADWASAIVAAETATRSAMPQGAQMPLAVVPLSPSHAGSAAQTAASGSDLSRADSAPLQVPTRYGTILVDIRPIRAFAKRIVTLFVQAGAVLEVNLGHTDRSAVGARLLAALSLKTSLPIKKQRKNSKLAASTPKPSSGVAPALRGLVATGPSSQFAHQASKTASAKLDEIASVFDPALLEMVRSTALNVYSPFIESDMAKILGIIEPFNRPAADDSDLRRL